MTLNAWQERLDSHFAQLHEQRLKSLQEYPVVYALEHGLSTDDVGQLKGDVQEWLKNTSPSRRHFLVWAVYSAEIGYQYSGEEYWLTFATLTPNWQDCQCNRDHIRDAFREFHRKYDAAKPRGPWAEQFTIICWPITHAILPKDLQRELAYILYELRGSFTPTLLRDTELLGQRIEDASWNSRARFRQFVEHHVLVGQIATALLLSDEDKGAALVLPSTLNRIAADLDRNQRSREWLGDARRRANQVRLRGLSQSISAEDDAEVVSAAETALSSRRREVLELGIEPEVFLERTGPNSWTVRLQLPSLAPLVQRFPRLRDVIANQRCVVAGAKGGPLARGYLLYGTQTVTLSRWPSSDEVLLKFDNFDPELMYLLTMECLLRPGPTWLFKIAPDGGTAAHIRTGVVQPGAEYILITRSNSQPPDSTLYSSAATVDCQDACALRLAVPDVITKIFQEQLCHVSIGTSSEIQVAPVGIPARKWDDSGTAEWISTDNPLIRISANFEVEDILLNLVGPTSNRLELDGPSWPLIVDLERLDSGVYNLHVLVSRPYVPTPTFGRLQFTIREPKPWNGAFPASTPFSARISPATPTLEELWEGKATIELIGPPDRKAEGSLAFYRNSSTESIYKHSFGPVSLPCSPRQWMEHWHGISADRCVENAYDVSSECELTVTCEELGRFTLRAVREPKPVRWVVKQQNNRYFLRVELLDEQVQPMLARCSFRSPVEFAPIQEDALQEFRVSEEGGLFAATADQYRDCVVIPPAIHSFKWLSAEVTMPQLPRSETSLGQIISGLEVWTRARAVGSQFAVDRKTAAINALGSELVRLVCGDEWKRQEQKYHHGQAVLSDFKNLISAAVKYSSLPRDILMKQEALRSLSLTEIVDTLDRLARSHLDLLVFSTAKDHGVSRQQWLTEFAYRLFLSPENIRRWAGNDFVPAIGYVLKNGALARLIRIVYLICQSPESNDAQGKAATV